MLIKSETNYQLQMISDTELWERMGIYMKENYGLEVSSKTYRKWVQKNTKRSHVSKLDGCEKCHRLKYDPGGLSDNEKNEFLIHQQLAKDQNDVKRMLIQAVADEVIPGAIITSMDFTKFDLSEK